MGGKKDDHGHGHGPEAGERTGPEVVFACYRAHAGKQRELDALVAKHMPTLRELELVTDRPSVLVRSQNGTVIEVFEWRSGDSSRQAHEHPKLAKIWEAMGKIADFPSLDSLEESKHRFCHFTPII